MPNLSSPPSYFPFLLPFFTNGELFESMKQNSRSKLFKMLLYKSLSYLGGHKLAVLLKCKCTLLFQNRDKILKKTLYGQLRRPNSTFQHGLASIKLIKKTLNLCTKWTVKNWELSRTNMKLFYYFYVHFEICFLGLHSV